jgi:hypothetical protein
MGHALMENRNGLIIGAATTRASGHAERLAALALIEPHADRPQPITLGADKGYDSGDFVMELRDKTVTPHVAQNQSGRRSAIDGRTARHPGYAVSQRIRKRIEEAFGWAGRWPACVRCGIVACPRSIGNSLSPWPPMISSACPSYLPSRWHDLGSRANRNPGPPFRRTADHPTTPYRRHRPSGKSPGARWS